MTRAQGGDGAVVAHRQVEDENVPGHRQEGIQCVQGGVHQPDDKDEAADAT